MSAPVAGGWALFAMALFGLAALFVVYTYALYPLLIHALGRHRARAAGNRRAAATPTPDAALPGVTFIIVARNEQDRIAGKLASCLAADYPADRLRLILAVDGPDPGTVAAAAAFGDPRVTVLAFPAHRGKAACLNDAVALAATPVLVMTDARQRIDPQAVRHLVDGLADPAVGAISGELMFEVDAADGVGQGIDAYWRYEKFIRRAESAAGSTVGVTGALYALRRSAWQPIPAGTILDDVLVPMHAVMAGWRVRFESRAIAWDRPSASLAQERARKIRTLAGNLQLLSLQPDLLSPRRNPILLQFLSHKIFRLLVPFALLAMLLTSLALAPGSALFAVLAALQLAGYALALAAGRWPALRRWLPARLASTFVAMNGFALLGVLAWWRGDALQGWAKTKAPEQARPPTRILYLVSLFPCWSETFIVREIQALLAQGADIRIMSLKPASETLVQQDAQALLDRVIYPPVGIGAIRAATGEILGSPWRSLREVGGISAGLALRPMELLKSLATWWRTLAMASQVRALAPTHLHAHWATYPSTAARILAGRLALPWSFTGHAHDIFAHDHFLAAKLTEASFAVTISAFNQRLLARRFPDADLSRLQVVHCGVRLQELPMRTTGRDPSRLVAVGRLDPIKGFRHLVEACRILQGRGLAFQCDIIGEGPLRPALAADIAAAGLEDRVRLLGALPQETVRERLAGAGQFVLPSVMLANGDADGIPVAMMEAMASGLPVVSTRVSGIPELVRDEVDGLLAPTGDLEQLAVELADRIERLIRDPALAARLAASARTQVETGFDAMTEGRRLLDHVEAASAPRLAGTGRLRLLLVTDEMEVGGSQRQIVQLARGLDPRDVEVTVAYFRHHSFLVDELRTAGIPVIEIPKRGRVDPRFVARLRRQLLQGRYDIVHCYSFTAELWTAIVRRLLPPMRRPVLVTSIRGTYEWYTALQWQAKRWISGQSRAVISNSAGGADYAARQMGWPRNRLRVVPNGVAAPAAEPGRRERLRAELLSDADGMLLLFVGRLVEHKNLPRLLQALAEVRRTPAGRAIQLAIAGDGPLRARLSEDIASLGLADGVRLLGERADVADLMAAADALVLPSLREGLSNVILEAMMSGLPVIASNAGGNPEVVTDRETGLMFRPDDGPALVDAIRTLAADPGLRIRLGNRGREQATDRFSPAAMTRAMREEYRLACDR